MAKTQAKKSASKAALNDDIATKAQNEQGDYINSRVVFEKGTNEYFVERKHKASKEPGKLKLDEAVALELVKGWEKEETKTQTIYTPA